MMNRQIRMILLFQDLWMVKKELLRICFISKRKNLFMAEGARTNPENETSHNFHNYINFYYLVIKHAKI